MINSIDINQVKKLIKTEDRPIVIKAQTPEFNRKILEYGKFDVLLSIEDSSKNNSLRTLDSSFNEVLGRIAHKNNVSLGIDLDLLRNKEKKDRAKLLEKISQNIMIARKTQVDFRLFNYNSKKSAASLLFSLGASSQQVKKALAF